MQAAVLLWILVGCAYIFAVVDWLWVLVPGVVCGVCTGVFMMLVGWAGLLWSLFGCYVLYLEFGVSVGALQATGLLWILVVRRTLLLLVWMLVGFVVGLVCVGKLQLDEVLEG